jgi:type II secretory pathway component PulJ
MYRPIDTPPGQRPLPRRAGPAKASRQARRMRGFGLLDGLVAMAILAFGLLALSRFQSRTVAAGKV